MDVIFNTAAAFEPPKSSLLVSQGAALLNLLAQAGYNPANPPLADVLRQCHHLDGEWLVATPIRWDATHNDAMITAFGEDLKLTEMQSQALFNAYAQYLAEEGLTLFYHDANHWLLRIDTKSSLQAKPVYQLLNQSLMPELDVLDNSLNWQKLITESQMFFASFTHNTPVNGVWFWGGARLSPPKPLALCVDSTFESMATKISSQVSVYNPSISLKAFSVLVFNEWATLTQAHQDELKKIPLNWYWNDIAYTPHYPNLFLRFWRTLFHDH